MASQEPLQCTIEPGFEHSGGCPRDCKMFRRGVNASVIDGYKYKRSALVIPMNVNAEFYKSFQPLYAKAQMQARHFSKELGVKGFSHSYIHSTIGYMCCLTEREIIASKSAASKINFQPFMMEVDHVNCNKMVKTSLSRQSIVAVYDKNAESKLQDIQESFETLAISKGVPIVAPRRSSFKMHTTIGTVASGFPIETLTEGLNDKIEFPWPTVYPLKIDCLLYWTGEPHGTPISLPTSQCEALCTCHYINGRNGSKDGLDVSSSESYKTCPQKCLEAKACWNTKCYAARIK
eukprot:CAMPEP_0185278326 /NCGR_PEP_ID=MMETSP1359-20130426/60763_1 /TAXON_ID=552665 /ORGANISM="Bigelowiella longifila, Strain CCMP242" /LENGTH=290 /DNA_ID=CAMNT_0027872783 /DNA_START=105 /DNA_END=977 /DNA_ORIENTATION=+